MQKCYDVRCGHVQYHHFVTYVCKAIVQFEPQRSQSVHPIGLNYIDSILLT